MCDKVGPKLFGVAFMYLLLILTVQGFRFFGIKDKPPIVIDKKVHMYLISMSCCMNIDMTSSLWSTSTVLGLLCGCMLTSFMEEYSLQVFRYRASSRINMRYQGELNELHKKVNDYRIGKNSLKIKNDLRELQGIFESISDEIPEWKYVEFMNKTKSIYDEL